MNNRSSMRIFDNDSKSEVTVTNEMQQKVAQNYNVITSSANVIGNAFYDIVTSLKNMRDEKLYLALGYNSFKQYCEEKLQISRSQACNYIDDLEYFGGNRLIEGGYYGTNNSRQNQKVSNEEAKVNEKLLEETMDIFETVKRYLEQEKITLEEINQKTKVDIQGLDEEIIESENHIIRQDVESRRVITMEEVSMINQEELAISISENRIIPFYPEEIRLFREALEESLEYFYDGPNMSLEAKLFESLYWIDIALKERGEGSA